MIEIFSDEFCAKVHRVLGFFLKDTAPPPPDKRERQGSAPPGPRP